MNSLTLSSLDTAIRLVADVLNRKIDDMTYEDELGSLPEWDSLSHIMIIEAVECHLGQRLDDALFEQLRSVKAIANFLEERSQ